MKGIQNFPEFKTIEQENKNIQRTGKKKLLQSFRTMEKKSHSLSIEKLVSKGRQTRVRQSY